jgi:pantoate--beta-alanine ligase
MSSASHQSGLPPVVDNIEQTRTLIADWKQAGDKIVFVPTMGNLHAGHLALIEAANALGGKTVVSIFVNPMQFGKDEDLETYPRTFDEDIGKLSKYNVNLVFAPGVDVIYPDDGERASIVDVPRLSTMLDGEHRPGFFKGVATVVNKLFNIIQPDVAIFGEKDSQQLLVIRQMVKDLAMPVEIRAVATVRESDGLAMSSRNNYLDDEQRVQAAVLHDCLEQVVKLVGEGEHPNYEVGHACQTLEENGFRVDYVVVRRQQDLAVPEVDDRALIVLAAVWLGDVRLIDNIPFEL